VLQGALRTSAPPPNAREHRTGTVELFPDAPSTQYQGGGWHAFRRGVATNLHDLGVDDKTIQAILRHSNIGITQNIYIKSVNKSQVSAMDALSENLRICNDLATNGTETIQ
jgi:hypothetical protein